jgi:non-ribosomal peptide synthase protein (TIGR01720 family)
MNTAVAIQAEQGPVTGSVPLTPIQHWFFEQQLPHPHHWNQAILLEARERLDAGLLAKALHHLQWHHDALRLQVVQSDSGWQQTLAEPSQEIPFVSIDLSNLPQQLQSHTIESHAGVLQASLNLDQGPLWRVSLFDLGPHEVGRLLIVIHHLAVDSVSWRILLDDLWTVYRQLHHGVPVLLPPKTTSFQCWAHRLAQYAQSTALQEEVAYWLDTARAPVTRLAVDNPEGRCTNTEVSARTVSVSLNEEETRALVQEVTEVYRTQINDVLLTALMQAVTQWTGNYALLLDLAAHGREELFGEVDLSRTVGWFTSIFPVRLTLERAAGPGEALRAVKEQLRAIPHWGIGYGVLRYLSTDADISEQLRSLPQAELSFSYLGQPDQVLTEEALFAPARESSGPTRSPYGSRRHLLDVQGYIAAGQLHLTWTYSKHVHQASTIEYLAQTYIDALQVLIDHCRSPEAGGYTPSDFPLAQLDQDALDKAFEEIEFEGR